MVITALEDGKTSPVTGLVDPSGHPRDGPINSGDMMLIMLIWESVLNP